MKDEIRKDEMQKCTSCKKGVMHNNLPLFWRVTVEHFGVDMKAVQRQAGFEMMVGHAGIAAVLGPNEAIAKRFSGPTTLFICEDCITSNKFIGLPIAIEELETTKETV